MKPLLACLAVVASTTAASSVARADDAPPTVHFVELTAGTGGLARDPGGDFSPTEEDESLSLGLRGGRFRSPTSRIALELSVAYDRISHLQPGESGPVNPEAATGDRLRGLAGVRLATRRGVIGAHLRIGLGLEHVAFAATYEDEYGEGELVSEQSSDLGPAFEMGAGVVFRIGRFDVGAEATLGVQNHDGAFGGEYDTNYFGIDTHLQLLAGYRF